MSSDEVLSGTYLEVPAAMMWCSSCDAEVLARSTTMSLKHTLCVTELCVSEVVKMRKFAVAQISAGVSQTQLVALGLQW